ncbi:MAG: hypothetical protein Q7W16_02405, partial [Coriobacteriia bacterium]|nr:hypothetical protein [Coriobacteriia bacterium]
MKRTITEASRIVLIAILLVFGVVQGVAAADSSGGTASEPTTAEIRAKVDRINRSRTSQAQRVAAAERLKLMQNVSGLV